MLWLEKKQKNLILLVILIHGFTTLASQEYLYPVAAFKTPEGSSKLFLLYQKSPSHVELWVWDPITKGANKALLSTYAPAGLRMLPDNSGFSFIDEDRIRIKKFAKRSPKTLEIYEPLHSLGPVSWLEDGTGYFHAKGKSGFSIFGISLDSELCCLAAGEGDCMYPSAVGSRLFFIERLLESSKSIDACFHLKPSGIQNYSYKLCSTPYQPFDGLQDKEVLIDFGSRPVAFLQMISSERGFIIEHPPVVDKHDKEIIFLVHELTKESSGAWKWNFLFSFSLPTSLLLSPDCLYETILPLLPRYYEGKLYFSDTMICSTGTGPRYCPSSSCPESLKLYYYCASRCCSNMCAITRMHPCGGSCSFAPVFCDGIIYYGGSLQSEGGPQMMMDELDELIIEMPSVKN